jgi:Leucine-rich repeat (LRR) protein
MPELLELYCSFNNIKDISPLAFHEKISVLDIEGNELSDES